MPRSSQERSRALSVVAAAYYCGLRALGATALKRHFQDAGLILCYHNVVSDGRAPAGDPGLHLPRAQFEQQMRWLADHYEIISLGRFVERLMCGDTLRSSSVVTFDDGYAGVFEHAVPILRELRIPATVFVVAEAAGRSAGFWWDQPAIVRSATPARRKRWLTELRGDEAAIRADGELGAAVAPSTHRPADWATIGAHLRNGIDIGVHSATHRSLPTLTDEELEHEIVTGRAAVYHRTGVWPDFFAYPYGLWDTRVREVVRRAGYRAGLTLGSGLNGTDADRWSLRRINVPARISHVAFEAWAAGFVPASAIDVVSGSMRAAPVPGA